MGRHSKLTPTQMAEVRTAYESKAATAQELATQYGVSTATIYNARLRAGGEALRYHVRKSTSVLLTDPSAPTVAYVQMRSGEVAIIDIEDVDLVKGYSWYMQSKGYAQAYGLDGAKQKVLMHHLIVGKHEGTVTDHVNQCRLDNRRSNLRVCTQAENRANAGGDVKGKPRGISRKSANTVIAQITVDKQHRYLGSFRTEAEAVAAYDRAAKEAWGEYYTPQITVATLVTEG